MSYSSLIRMISIRLSAFVIVFALFSCNTVQKPEQSDPAKAYTDRETNNRQISLQVSTPERLHSKIAILAAAFEVEHPDIQIQLISRDEILPNESTNGYGWSIDAYRKLAQTADVFFLPATPDAVQAGVIHDLYPFFTAADATFQSDFYPGTLDAFLWNDGLWSLPTGFSHILLYYNKTLFDASNLPYPTPDWTWNQFATTVEALTTQDNGTTTQWGFLSPSDSHAPILISMMAQELTTQQLISSDLFTTPQFEAALDSYDRLFPSGHPALDQGQGTLQQITKGRVAMWAASAIQYDQFADQVNVGVVALPTGKQRTHTTPLYVSGLSMSAGTLNPSAAWAWIRFLSGQEMSRFAERQIPARVSVAEASGAWDRTRPELGTAMRIALNQNYPANAIWQEQHLDEAVAEMISGGKTVTDVLYSLRSSSASPIRPTVEVMVEPPATAVPDSVSINYVADFTQNDLTALRRLAADFVHDNPNFNVSVLSGTELDSFSAAAQAGHCFEWSPALANKETILPLDPFIEAEAFELTDYYPGLLADFRRDGTQWGIPASIAIYVIKYNKDLFDQADVAYPENGWRITEFLETAIALTSGNGNERIYGFVAGANELSLPNYLLEPLGAKLIDDSVEPPTMLFNSPNTIDAMRWLTDLSTVYDVKPVLLTDLDSFSQAQQEGERLIVSDRAAMWLELGSTPDDVSLARSDMHIGTVSFPISPGGRSGGYQRETGFFISANTSESQRQACWQWIVYLSQHPTGVKEAPARRSVLTSKQYRQLVGNELASTYSTVLEQSNTPTAWSRTSTERWMSLGKSWLLFAYLDIIVGERSVEEATSWAQSIFDEYRACIITHEGLSDPNIQRECYCEEKDNLPPEIVSLSCSG